MKPLLQQGEETLGEALTQEDWDYACQFQLANAENPLWVWAKDLAVFERQLRALALSQAAKRKNARQTSRLQQDPVESLLSRDLRILQQLKPGQAFEHASFEAPSLYQTDCLEMAKCFKQSQLGKSALVLLGGTGSGKTYAGLCLLVARMRQGHAGEILTHYELSEILGHGEAKEQERKRLKNIPNLMLDDLRYEGEGRVTEAFRAFIDELVDYRCYRHKKLTIFTSNATVEQFSKTYGCRVVSRLRECGTVFETTQNDMRKTS